MVVYTPDALSLSTEAVCAGIDAALASSSAPLASRDGDGDAALTLDERRGAKPPRRGVRV